jgi:sialidase-1
MLLFSNCKSPNRRALLYIRASLDDGKTWSDGICIEPKGAAYSDMTILPNGDIGILYEGAGYSTINFTTVTLADIKAQITALSK